LDKKRANKTIKTNNGSKITNINGTINLQTKELRYVEDERINSQTILRYGSSIILGGMDSLCFKKRFFTGILMVLGYFNVLFIFNRYSNLRH
jgi:hypothetical protein